MVQWQNGTHLVVAVNVHTLDSIECNRNQIFLCDNHALWFACSPRCKDGGAGVVWFEMIAQCILPYFTGGDKLFEANLWAGGGGGFKHN